MANEKLVRFSRDESGDHFGPCSTLFAEVQKLLVITAFKISRSELVFLGRRPITPSYRLRSRPMWRGRPTGA
jgi:hypothetical protein